MEVRRRPSGWRPFTDEIRLSQVTQNLLASFVADFQCRLPVRSTAFQRFTNYHGDGSPPWKPIV